jgi:cytochrome c oxidase assembly protein subunit 15
MLNRFQKWAILTTIATYFLIAVGAMVRAAGAGMGCPDWPRCFDRWIPPTDVSQVPPHIDPALFNVRLAWIEYLNRLVGVSIGIFIAVALYLALRHYRNTPRVLWPTVFAFFGVGFEGWLGAKVVSSNLDPHMITVHLVMALLVVSALLYATVCAFFPGGRPLENLPVERRALGQYARNTLLVLLLQIGMGAWLRGDLEVVAKSSPELDRADWILKAGLANPLHRFLAVVVTLLVGYLYLRVRRVFGQSVWLNRAALSCVVLVLLQLLLGVVLAKLALPPVAQVLHLTIGSLLMGALTVVILLAYRLPASLIPVSSAPSTPAMVHENV